MTVPIAASRGDDKTTRNVSFRFRIVLDERFEAYLLAEKQRTRRPQSKVKHIQMALVDYLDRAEGAKGDVAQCPVCESVVFDQGLAEKLLPAEHEEAVRLLVGVLSSQIPSTRRFAENLIPVLRDIVEKDHPLKKKGP